MFKFVDLSLIVVSVFVSLTTFIYLYFKWKFGYYERRGLPYIPPRFPFGNLAIPPTKEYLGVTMIKFYKHFKSQNEKLGGFFIFDKPAYVVSHPEIVRKVMVSDFNHFMDHGAYYNEKDDPLSANLVYLKGEKWRSLRNKLTVLFTSNKLKTTFPTLVSCSKLLEQSIRNLAENKEPIQIKEIFGRFSTDVIGSCAFGLDCKSFEGEDAEFRKYGRKIFAMSQFKMLFKLFSLGFPNFARFFKVKVLDDDVSKFFMKIVKETIDYRENNKITRDDFMQLMIDLKNSGSGLSLNETAALSFGFFTAGFETSATVASFCLYELSINQDIQDKLRREIRKMLEQTNGEFDYNALVELKYLGQVLDETLRKYPTAIITDRECTRDWEYPERRYTVKRGQRMFIPVYSLHYDPEYFPEPEKFDPDRFSVENKDKIVPYTYVPFGEGPRQCIGLRFGLLQSRIGIAGLLNKFKFTLSDKTKLPLRIGLASPLYVRDPIYLNAEELNIS